MKFLNSNAFREATQATSGRLELTGSNRRSLLLIGLAASAVTLSVVAGCGGGDDAPTVAQIEAACPSLAGQNVAAASIGLPTTGATISAATLVAATTALPEYCKVIAAIAPVDSTAPAINIQVNLPSAWNGKFVQYGGSGLNGTVVTGLASLRAAAPNAPVPLALGYATFGGDSGHVSASSVALPTWALNDEALTNFAYASLKKTHDVAINLMAKLYAAAPAHGYFAGSSEGGREAMTVAQRFPADYDGVIAVVPVIPYVGLQTQGNRVSTAVKRTGAWMDAPKVSVLSSATLAACDAADGVSDGIISNFLSCHYDPTPLRCAGGVDTGDTCLSDAQLGFLNTDHTALQLGFALTNGTTSYPGWQWGSEGLGVLDNFTFWQSGATAPAATPAGVIALFGDYFVKYFVTQNAAFDPTTFVPTAYQARMLQLSSILDADNPDLSAFKARGGKLIMKEVGGDYAQSPLAGIDYYNRVVTKLTQTVVDSFLRFYVTPGVSHMGLGGPDYVDLLGALDTWVTSGAAPVEPLIQTSLDASFNVTRSRPMCRYPTYPRYNGTGDVNAAASFTCTAP